ncbi:uncharacterized protein Dana_GF20334 [Drosophila ananassae]|uniref:Uncharacterized protein n=1 Tax=Drosophila ananassae TaxID=7217 RepID=B3MQ03_DROAN|nr:uncharacterized protein LOC6503044 [Drosophila ananassae]EDV44429.1 uncharacterized protein Dana_GF20334 [Drosophila ananassae]
MERELLARVYHQRVALFRFRDLFHLRDSRIPRVPRWLWILLLVELLSVLAGAADSDSDTEMAAVNDSVRFSNLPERCQYLVAEVQVFERKCRGSFPLVAFTKYRDTFIKAGEPFALYMPSTLDHVLVLMKKSSLQECRRFEVVDVGKFICLDHDHNETIVLDKTNIYCFPFHIQLPDDLMQDCVREQKTSHIHLEDVLRARRGIIHYTFGGSGADTCQTVLPWLSIMTLITIVAWQPQLLLPVLQSLPVLLLLVLLRFLLLASR